jgi:hypothetical protein
MCHTAARTATQPTPGPPCRAALPCSAAHFRRPERHLDPQRQPASPSSGAPPGHPHRPPADARAVMLCHVGALHSRQPACHAGHHGSAMPFRRASGRHCLEPQLSSSRWLSLPRPGHHYPSRPHRRPVQPPARRSARPPASTVPIRCALVNLTLGA